MAMTILPTTTGGDDAAVKHPKTEWHDPLSLHADGEAILRVVFKVGTPGPEKPHRYYRAIVRGPSGDCHLAGGHMRVARGGKYVEDPSAGSESPFWVERGVGLESALREVNGFVPKHQGADTYVTAQFLEGRMRCLRLWQTLKDTGL
jgi:hypothetical protein